MSSRVKNIQKKNLKRRIHVLSDKELEEELFYYKIAAGLIEDEIRQRKHYKVLSTPAQRLTIDEMKELVDVLQQTIHISQVSGS